VAECLGGTGKLVLGLASLGAIVSVQPAGAVTQRVCNFTVFGEATSQSAKCRKPGAQYYNCTTENPIGGLAAKKVCFDVEVQPGAPSATGATSPSARYKPN